MDVRLNGEPYYEEVNCLKNQGSQVAGDGGPEMDVVTE